MKYCTFLGTNQQCLFIFRNTIDICERIYQIIVVRHRNKFIIEQQISIHYSQNNEYSQKQFSFKDRFCTNLSEM